MKKVIITALVLFGCHSYAKEHCVPAEEVNRELSRLSGVIASLTIENELLRNGKLKQYMRAVRLRRELDEDRDTILQTEIKEASLAF